MPAQLHLPVQLGPAVDDAADGGGGARGSTRTPRPGSARSASGRPGSATTARGRPAGARSRASSVADAPRTLARSLSPPPPLPQRAALKLWMFEHVPGARLCEGLFGHYTMPDGTIAHLFARDRLYDAAAAMVLALPPPRLLLSPADAGLPGTPPPPLPRGPAEREWARVRRGLDPATLAHARPMPEAPPPHVCAAPPCAFVLCEPPPAAPAAALAPPTPAPAAPLAKAWSPEDSLFMARGAKTESGRCVGDTCAACLRR